MTLPTRSMPSLETSWHSIGGAHLATVMERDTRMVLTCESSDSTSAAVPGVRRSA